VPFSEIVDWVTATPRVIKGLATESLAVPNFDAEEEAGVFNATLKSVVQLEARNFGTINATNVLNMGEVTSDKVCFYGTTTQLSAGIPRKPMASIAEVIPNFLHRQFFA
jgi:hypothetical protein